jgi:hypothetical protein
MTFDFHSTRDLLHEFNFSDIFVRQLGWSFPPTNRIVPIEVKSETYYHKMIAELSGVVVFEITSDKGQIPDAKTRRDIHEEISELHLENLLIFLDSERTQSLWYWMKRDGAKSFPREHLYIKGQPGDLFLGKLASLVVDLSELEDGLLSVVEVARRLKEGLDVERVTKKFFKEFQNYLETFIPLIEGIDQEADQRWYASVIFNRLMFIYFLQYKGFLDNGNHQYLQNKLEESKQRGSDCYYHEFLQTLFFEGFAQPESQRKKEVQALIGKIKYLNGGLFLKHKIEQIYSDIFIPDHAFESILNLFSRYSWQLDDTPGGQDNEVNPGVLGYIFEKYINQKAFGAYYTRPEITEYLCDRTINAVILDRINSAIAPRQFENINELLIKLDANICRQLIWEILPNLSLLDPACGSGAFLIAALRTLINIYSAVIARIEFTNDHKLKTWLRNERSSHHDLAYFIKKRIITDNLYGVDIMEEATEIAKLRLFLALVSSAQEVDDLEPLPNIDFNIMAGNSLIGLIRVDGDSFDSVGSEEAVQGNLLTILSANKYQNILADRNRSIELYKNYAFTQTEQSESAQEEELLQLRNHIEKLNQDSQEKLNGLLLEEFSNNLGIKYEQIELTKRGKRLLTVKDIEKLEPFHWGYHFNKIIDQHGGFDAIITNPPWEIFKPNAKEFFAQYSDLVKKKKMDIHDFEDEQTQLLQDPEVATAWIEYQSQYPHVSNYYRLAQNYKNQIPTVNGKKVGSDHNLYKLFLEQCFNLLRLDGECGIVIPSGIYTDLGTKKLREMLFHEAQITGLFCFENRKSIFEGVDSRFKFVVLTFSKGGQTKKFPVDFMRHDVEDLQNFPHHDSLFMSVEFVCRSSPNSMSIIEFKNKGDLQIAEKLLNYPLLYGSGNGWNLELYGEELHMNRSKKYFQKTPTSYPLYEGGMIWQFDHNYAKPKYWIREFDLERIFLAKRAKRIGLYPEIPGDLKNDYEVYRIAIRKIASNTNERTLVSTIIPDKAFAGNSLTVNFPFYHSKDSYNELRISNLDLVVLVSLVNSFVVDYSLRSRMTTNLNTFYLYQLSVPRLRIGDQYFIEIVERAAKLICTTPEFDNLAKEVGLGSYTQGVTNEIERRKLRAELDGMIAHIYGLTEEEFTYILTTFNLVPDNIKQAALYAYQELQPLSGDSEVIDLIIKGESYNVEFKSTARWNLVYNKQDKAMEQEIVKTVAGFLNTQGGTLLIGVNDNGEILGLQYDYQTLGKQNQDGYILFLNNDLLLREIGRIFAPYLKISCHQVSGQDVCRIIVQPSPEPVYIKIKDKTGKKEIFFIRSNNSTLKLNEEETEKYIQQRWG